MDSRPQEFILPDRHDKRPFPDSQIDFDIEFFDLVLENNPNDISVLRCQAELLARRGELERALTLDRRLVGLRPDDCIARYNFACSLALGEHPQEAIQVLRQAIAAGYDDFEYLAHDADLDNLRGEPGFKKLLRENGLPD